LLMQLQYNCPQGTKDAGRPHQRRKMKPDKK
jgi:hypothetical protein